jgi:hypothetical protein
VPQPATHAAVSVQPKDEDDGCFWMPWDEFWQAGFRQIDVCDRTTKDDLRLDVAEDMGPCGVCVGALLGVSRYLCLCQGVRYLYFEQNSSEQTKSAKRGCGCCQADNAVAPVDLRAP